MRPAGVKPSFEYTQRFGLDRSKPLAVGLEGFWLFNEGAGRTVYDLSGNGRHATMGSATDPAWVNINGSLGLHFSSQWLTVAGGDYVPPQQGSVCIWASTESTDRQRPIGFSDKFEVKIQAANVTNDLFAGGSLITYSFGDFGRNRYRLWVSTWDYGSTEQKIYLDEKLDNSGSNANDAPGSGVLSIGRRTGSTNYFTGTINQVRIYDFVLSDQDVMSLYADPYSIVRHERVKYFFSTTVAAVTKTASLDSLIKKTGIFQTASIDSLIQSAKDIAVDLDALLYLVETGQLSLDAFIEIAQEQTVSTDALIQAAKSGDISIDAFLHIVVTEALSLNALIQALKTSGTDLDAIITGSTEVSASLDALIQDVKTGAVSLDAILYNINTSSLSFDSLIMAIVTSGVGLDAIIGGGGIVTASLDAMIQGIKTGEISLDALIQDVGTGNLSLDAFLFATGIEVISLDAMVMAVRTGLISLDALISITQTNTISLDAILFAAGTGTISIDAIIGLASTIAVDIDALLFAYQFAGMSIDAILGATSITPHQVLSVPDRLKTINVPGRAKLLESPERLKLIKS